MSFLRQRALTLSICAAVASLALASTAQASTVNLLASGTQSFSANSTNTVYSLTDIQPAGSGVFNPFVRIQAPGPGGPEQGYNTQDTAGTMENTTNGPANPLIVFSDVVDINHKINLALDLNETGATTSNITLENLVLVVSTNPNKAGPDGTDPFTIQSIPLDPGDVILFDMSTSTRTDGGHVGESYNIFLDANDNLASGNGGSGQADLLVQIDVLGLNLSILDPNHFLYVYSRFSDGHSGYEECRIQTPTTPLFGNAPPIPEPASLGHLALGITALLLRRRRKED